MCDRRAGDAPYTLLPTRPLRTAPTDRELWWRQSSFKSNEITTEAQAEGAIEGSGEDYKVANV